MNNELTNNNSNFLYNNTHPNIKYLKLEYDEKTNKYKKYISIEQIRNLRNFLNQSALDNKPKFVIIDSSDDLNINSANSLLKTLEEPKNNTFFILIAHQFSNLVPTIRSRCVNYNFKNPSYTDFSQILLNNEIKLNISDINFLYYLTNSSAGLAYDIFTDKIIDNYNDIVQILIDNDPLSLNVINLVNLVGKYPNNEFKNFLILLKFIIMLIIKINLGYVFDNDLSSNSIKYLLKIANNISNSTLLNILEFLNANEKDLFIYNLDKKLFCFEIFSSLNK